MTFCEFIGGGFAVSMLFLSLTYLAPEYSVLIGVGYGFCMFMLFVGIFYFPDKHK